jgi:soluble lytic murein transglycosylase-like protein
MSDQLDSVPAAPTAAQTRAPLDRDAVRVLSLAASLTAAARAHNIDPLLLHAIAHVESRHNARAVSPAGARGVMQVMPATGRRFGVKDDKTLFDADTNLRASAAYLRTLRDRHGDDLRLVLAAYNAGEGAVEKHGRNVPPYPETQAYVRDVIAVHRRLSAQFAVSPSGDLIARAEAAKAVSGEAR